MQKYEGTTVGPLKIPYKRLWTSPTGIEEKDLQIDIDTTPFEIPDGHVKQYAEENKKTAEKTATDGKKARLTRYEATKTGLKLYLQLTSFFQHMSTNLSLDKDVVWQMVEKKGADYGNLDDGLANPIGNEAVVVSKDGYILIEERADTITQYPGLYGIPSGFTDPAKDEYNPFKTAKMILKEQLNLEEIESIKLLGVGRAGDDRHIELQWLVKTSKKMDEILEKAPKPSKLKKRERVKFTPEEVAKYLSKTVRDVPDGAVKRGNLWIPGESPKWVPAQAIAVINALVNTFGYDKVEKAIENEFKKL